MRTIHRELGNCDGDTQNKQIINKIKTFIHCEKEFKKKSQFWFHYNTLSLINRQVALR